MSIIIYSIIYAALMIMVTKAPVAFAMNQLGGYDNREPREQQSRLTGFGLRAMGAHNNSIEAFPLFAAGALLVLITGQQENEWVIQLCWAFVISRAVYSVLYLLNWHLLRSLSWGVGFASSIALMFQALPAAVGS